MNKSVVIKYLEANQDSRGIAHWEKHKEESGGLHSYGIGLTKLRRFAKEIGRDAKLARHLWQTDIYEARILALLVDDPKKMTIEQAEAQVEQLQGGYLAHVFSSCDATLAKAPFARELMEKWVTSKDAVRIKCGHGLLYEISKWKTKNAPDDELFPKHLDRIGKSCSKQPTPVLLAMGTAVMGIGTRNRKLNTAAIKVAKKIGSIEYDPDGRCGPMDFAEKLSHKQIQRRLGA
jgi:hypothetical protein